MNLNMEWEEIFKDYTDIMQNEHITSFCDEEDNWLLELKHIFLHETKSEMFLLLDLSKNIEKLYINYNIDTYEKLLTTIISTWEESVLNYINFDLEDEKISRILKYNITLIILCKKDMLGKNSLTESSPVIQEEKSTSICRKIFIFNDKDNLEHELNYLPFYFGEVENKNRRELEELEDELKIICDEAEKYLNNLMKDSDEVEK
ncbi:hypothetical protein [uncultured Clostridium sp.]|uniref:hypothetical protein n=1 Tax=uncultured Clostridium sp. TaxID=59620 RepID=UPI0025E89E31|nr:hypothetical protein [uncultured Clostridium sp.]